MQAVSQAWRDNQAQTLVEESFVEISYGITDPEAVADANATDNGSVYISDTSKVVNEITENIPYYATLERNTWFLNGSIDNIPSSDYGDNGYISNVISDENGDFSKTPYIDISFTTVHVPVIPSITITWGIAYGEYAKNFRITAYFGSSVVAQILMHDNSSIVSVVELPIENYDKIKIEILKWSESLHRARVADVFLGINKIYTKSDLTSFNHSQFADPISAELPKSEIQFGISNVENEYDPNNAESLSKYLMERQEIKTRYGYKLGSSIEWIPGGVFYLTEWDAPQNGIEATFKGRDMLELLTDIYTKGMYSPSGTSLYDLAIAVLTAANLPLNKDGSVKWIIDDSLKTIYTNAPLPMISQAECLQLIANAGCCVMYADRLGKLHIEPAGNTITDYNITLRNSYTKSEISLQKPLKQVDISVYRYFISETGKELYNGIIPINGEQKVIITYQDMATNVSASVTGGTLVSANYYSNKCELTISGTGDVTVIVTGDMLKQSENILSIANETKGETEKVQNLLITDAARGQVVGDWIKSYLNNRKIISSNWRADPRVDTLDIVTNVNKFNSNSVRLTSVNISFAGAFKGTAEGRMI